MKSPDSRNTRPSTFASIRFFAENLKPTVVSNFFRLSPTLSYERGEHYGRSNQQTRRFGLWLFRTENIVHSSLYVDHLDFVIFNFLPPNHEATVKEFLGKNDYNMVVSLFWHGKDSDGVPHIDDRHVGCVRNAGGKIEAEYDIVEDSAGCEV